MRRGERTGREEDGEGSRLPLWRSLGLIGVLLCLYFFWPAFRREVEDGYQVLSSEDRRQIASWIQQFGAAGPLILVGAMTAQMFLFVIPSVVLMAVCVVGYGPFLGGLLAVSAVLVASTVGYFLGAALGPAAVEKLIGSKTRAKIDDFIEDYGSWAVVVTRISPFLSNDAIGIAAGMLKMGYWKYLGATTLGIVPLTSLLAYFGNSTESLENGLVWVSVVGFVSLAAHVFYDRKVRASAGGGARR